MPTSSNIPAHSDKLTVLEAAREYPQFSAEYLRIQIRKGALPAEKSRQRYLIRRTELDMLPDPAPGRTTDRDRRDALIRSIVAQAPKFSDEQRRRISSALEPFADGGSL